MAEEKRYSLMCAYNPNFQRKTIVSKVMFDTSTNYSLMTIDDFMFKNGDKGMPVNSRLYIFDNETQRVLPILPRSLDKLSIDAIKQFMYDKNNNLDVMQDEMWRGPLESILLKDLVKGNIQDKIREERNNDGRFYNKEKLSFFYSDKKDNKSSDVDVLLILPYLPRPTARYDHSHFEYNVKDNRYYIVDVPDSIMRRDQHIKEYNEYIEKLCQWYSEYRNFRNYFVYRMNIFKRNNYDDEFTQKDISTIHKYYQTNTKMRIINFSQQNIFDAANAAEKEERISKMFMLDNQNTEEQENGIGITEKQVKKIIKKADELGYDPDEDILDVVDENTQPKNKHTIDEQKTVIINPYEPKDLTADEQQVEEDEKADNKILAENVSADYNHLDALIDEDRTRRKEEKKREIEIEKQMSDENRQAMLFEEALTDEHRNHPEFVKKENMITGDVLSMIKK
jgi:hypothetical protein